MQIKEAHIKDAKLYVEHSERLLATNVKDGIIFSPREPGTYKTSDEDIKITAQRWSKKPHELGFEKSWLVWDNEQVVGHILIRGGRLESLSHRADLQMGIETKFRGKGLGKELISLALLWVKDNTALEWIDLAVFSQNLPGLKLYNKFGFKESGRTIDRFRVSGISVDNVELVLRIVKTK